VLIISIASDNWFLTISLYAKTVKEQYMNCFDWRVLGYFFMTIVLSICPVFADQDLAKQAQNPIANLISLPL